MSLETDFEIFIGNLEPTNISEMEITVGEIAKKLNKNYYNLDSDKISHMYIVGSVGRGTAIKGVSDLDILFDLSQLKYLKDLMLIRRKNFFLTTRSKKCSEARYPNTDISGDGQVVVIKFNKYTIELVPGFKQSDVNLNTQILIMEVVGSIPTHCQKYLKVKRQQRIQIIILNTLLIC